MSTMLIYLFKASITLGGLYLVFWLFLRKDTFHQLKRFVLLANLMVSLLLPLLNMAPLQFNLKKTNNIPLKQDAASVSQFALADSQPIDPAKASDVPWIETAGFVYLAVLLILLTRFIIQLFSVYRLIGKAQVISHQPLLMASSTKINSPFSFFRYLILNPEPYEPATLSQIIKHEQVHIAGHHTIDRLLAEIYTIFFWFNPVAWMHQNLMKLNLEYIADQAVLNAGFTAESYQSNLLKLIRSDHSFPLANNFNQSGLLKRIRMMNKPVSPFRLQLKIALVLPVLIGCLLLFNGTQAKKVEKDIQLLSGSFASWNQHLIQISSQQEPSLSSAATRTITGIVKDADTDKPLAGVLIQVKGQSISTRSYALGKFNIEVGENDKALVFQIPDYNTSEMAITSQNEMTVLLKPIGDVLILSTPTYLLADTIIINSSGSNVLNSYSVKDVTASNTEIRGRKIEIRDSSSLSDENILYLIDGKVVDKAQLNKIRGEEIATINIYKDINSLRKFGAEDKKGVIEIKLKK